MRVRIVLLRWNYSEEPNSSLMSSGDENSSTEIEEDKSSEEGSVITSADETSTDDTEESEKPVDVFLSTDIEDSMDYTSRKSVELYLLMVQLSIGKNASDRIISWFNEYIMDPMFEFVLSWSH
ncbi:hypothetical protein BJV82DRAFT_581695 [Fennellomyces sp. T-0311]|nr:hypothetical protein BJV82DRAFT_581695 [Fennellomyces sp. T-0311]